MNYIGKICPYCKTELTAEDDVVVCSICEMPHHKECWIENKACTTFGCTGTIAGLNQREIDASAKTVFCHNCGAEMKETQKFCATCGAPIISNEPHFQVAGGMNQPFVQPPVVPPVYTTPQSTMYAPPQPIAQPPVYAPPQPIAQPPVYAPPQPVAPAPSPVYATPQQMATTSIYNPNYGMPQAKTVPADPDEAEFIQINQVTYTNAFAYMRANDTMASWNWSSFLLGPFWFAYRKMYATAGVYLGISLLTSFLPMAVFIALLAILRICSGVLGNNFYMGYVEDEVKLIKGVDREERTAHIFNKGSTGVYGVGIMLAITVAFVVVRVLI